MGRWSKKFSLHQPTITRDLTLGLLAVVAVVLAISGLVNYFYTEYHDQLQLEGKAVELANDMASVLATPMWNLNIEEVKKIVSIYRRSDLVLDLSVVDDVGADMVPYSKNRDNAMLELTRTIHLGERNIGTLHIAFIDQGSHARSLQMLLYSLSVFSLLTSAIATALTALLRRVVKEPLTRLSAGLADIAGGNYDHHFEMVRQVDMNQITDKVTVMSQEIAKRERSLNHNRNQLETLNQAILDIFSCSDAPLLVRQTLAMAYRVCGVDHSWFVADVDQSNTPGGDKLTPLAAVRGQLFPATEREVRLQMEKQDGERTFSFPIRSRSHNVGHFTLAFPTKPEATVAALLRSLMSIATLAMMRLSLIRETALIAAELQVAETVQRSMIIDEAKLPPIAAFAFHYEPVLRVGGDWFSVTQSGDGSSVYVILGDVTGHGLAQGLITTAMAGAMNIIEAMIHDFDQGSISRPAQIVTLLNNVMNKLVGKSNLRMTCVAAQLDFAAMQLTICNAGHTFPLILRQSGSTKPKLESLAKNQQFMLGDDSAPEIASHQYTDTTYSFSAEDLLLFYTDGLTEALDKDGRPFVRKFQRHISKVASAQQVGGLCQEVLTLFHDHVKDVPVKDDICLVVVGKKPLSSVKAA